jgi:hypothetical protein
MARAPRGRSLSIGSLVQSKPTRARVHGRDELEAGRHLHRPARPRDRDPALLERLAQRLARGPVELGQLIEEKDAVVGPGHFARRQPGPSAHERRVGGRVMRRPERPLRDEASDGPFPGH